MKIAQATVLLFATTLITLVGCGDKSDRANVIENKGSDTLVNVAGEWAEAYMKKNPDIRISVNGGGSGTGISALINGTVGIANASRKMKTKEVDLAKSKGITPVEHTVGFDALAVFVHKDNPIKSLSIEQLADIYGEGGKITKWSQLGVKVPGGHDEIVRISRQNNSGTYAYFRKAVLAGGDYKLGSRDLHGSKDVVETCERTPSAIGYSGLAYATDHVRMVPIIKDGKAPVTPSVDTAVDKTYPIARPLLMYTAGSPEGNIKSYLDWILSDEGQKIILNMGYAPVRDIK